MDAEQTAVRLVLDRELYDRVRHAAVDAHCSASAWIRDAITAKLDGVPEDAALGRVVGDWGALRPEGRERLADYARILVQVPEMRRPPEWEEGSRTPRWCAGSRPAAASRRPTLRPACCPGKGLRAGQRPAPRRRSWEGRGRSWRKKRMGVRVEHIRSR